MLAKPIYELVPYGYFFLGISCIALANNYVPTLIGVILFLLGANIWRMRSEARRTDHSSQRVKQKNVAITMNLNLLSFLFRLSP